MPRSELEKTVVFGHLAIGGALHNISGSVYRGSLTPKYFSNFQKTFSGHFHVHQKLGTTDNKNLVYVGSPMQFNFGDASDTRGIVIYDLDGDSYEHIPNPDGRLYMVIPEGQLASPSGGIVSSFNGEPIEGKHIRVQFERHVPLEQVHELKVR